MIELQNAYAFDKTTGYFTGVEKVMPGLLPDNVVEFAPGTATDSWYKINEDHTAWTTESKPDSASACIGLTVQHSDHTPRGMELRALMEKLTTADSDHYRLVRDEGTLELTVEAIPEKTEEEKQIEELQAQVSDYDTQLATLKEQMTVAQLAGDDELIAELQAEYKTLMES